MRFIAILGSGKEVVDKTVALELLKLCWMTNESLESVDSITAREAYAHYPFSNIFDVEKDE